MAISDIFGGVGGLFQAQGDFSAANLYQEAATLAGEEENVAKQSTAIQQKASQQQTFKAIGSQQASVGTFGSASGTALDLLRSSRQQGSLQQQMLQTSGNLQNLNFQIQATSAESEAAQANAAGDAATAKGIGGLVGGLFSLFSDRRLKRDIVRLGSLNGFPLVAFRWKWGRKWHIGFIAQEVQYVHPELVHRHWSGFLKVDYGSIIMWNRLEGGHASHR